MQQLDVENLATIACWIVERFAGEGESERFQKSAAEHVVQRVRRVLVHADDARLSAALTELIFAIEEEQPLGHLNRHLAIGAAITLANKNGFELVLPSESELNRLLMDRDLTRGWISSSLRPMSSPKQLSLIEGSSKNFFQGEEVRAYVVSSLTALEEAQHTIVVARSNSVAAALQELGMDVHEPCLHTDPISDPDIPPTLVHRLDYEQVINADFLVGIGDWPSWGGGKELAWADSSLVPVLVLLSPDKRISRLVVGSTGNVAERVATDDEVGEVAKSWVLENADLIRSHARLRNSRETRFGAAARFLQVRITSGEQPWDSSLMTPERFAEIALSASHLAMTTLEQALLITESTGLPLETLYSSVSPQGHQSTPTAGAPTEFAAFERLELLALETAARLRGWSAEDVLKRLVRAHQLRRTEGIRRQHWRNAEDWMTLDVD